MARASLRETFQITGQAKLREADSEEGGSQVSIRGHVKTEVFPRAVRNYVEAIQSRKSPKLKRFALQGQSKQDLFSCPSILIYSYSEVTTLKVTRVS